MKALLVVLLSLSTPAVAGFNLQEVLEQANDARLSCFHGYNHDGVNVSGPERDKACQDLAKLLENAKANNICKTPDGVLVECPG